MLDRGLDGWFSVRFLYGSIDSQITTLFIDKVNERFNIGESCPLRFFFEISLKWGRFADKPSGNVSNLFRKHRVSECKAAPTPLTDKRELTKDQMQEDGSDVQQQLLEIDYRGLLGSIENLSLSNRPNLAFPTNLLSRFLGSPGFTHWQAAKYMLRYLRGTADVGIIFMKCDDTCLNVYTDSGYASCKNRRRIITGFCFNVGSGS